ncbi:hypothetical protein Taro_023874 [Colocasia esculenta]|uniref:Uncharacterized protein n=1 Tax=Colocasia esculenta TaxID=4460 RepID=A0A843V7P5_COLES|nr:hypothetical protein [Colocasia esculenta]
MPSLIFCQRRSNKWTFCYSWCANRAQGCLLLHPLHIKKSSSINKSSSNIKNNNINNKSSSSSRSSLRELQTKYTRMKRFNEARFKMGLPDVNKGDPLASTCVDANLKSAVTSMDANPIPATSDVDELNGTFCNRYHPSLAATYVVVNQFKCQN